MSRGRTSRVRDVFADVAALPPDRREAAARKACAGDAPVLREVLRLLPHADLPTGDRFLEPPSFLGGPPQDLAADAAGTESLEGRLLGGRYRLGAVLGRGGGGVVHDATDTTAERSVAVKVMPGLGREERLRVRREIATLRWLRLPGVVRMLDDGAEGDLVYCVMERVEGHPFPGRAAPDSWAKLAPAALALLDALARVHWAGVVHRDLKPSNVLVGDAGRVTILDLGASGERTTRHGPVRERWTAYTPGYAAPEQVAGAEPDPRSDLHAVGVMLFEVLAGRKPPPTAAARRAACRDLPAPPRVRRTIASLLEPDRERRPPSAADAARALSAQPARDRRRRRPWTHRELRERFLGFDVVHHLRDDAASELLRRTGGSPAAVESELGAWVRAGLAVEESGRLRVERPALERLRHLPCADGRELPPPPSGRTRAARAADRAEAEFLRALRAAGPSELARAALAAADAAVGSGRNARAVAFADEGLRALRVDPHPGLARRLLVSALGAALALGSPAAMQDVLRAAELAHDDDEVIHHVEAVARSVIVDLRSDPGRALRTLEPTLRSCASSPLRMHAWAVAVVAARRSSPERELRLIRRAAAWIRRHPTAKGRRMLLAWSAWRLYRRHRFRAAAAAQIELATSAPDPVSTMRHLLDAACAHLDALDPAAASTAARRALSIATEQRSALHEARARVLMRTANYRASLPTPDDPDLLAALRELGNDQVLAEALTNEAAILWRQRRTAECIRTAEEAATLWARFGRTGPEVLMRAVKENVCTTLGPEQRAALKASAEAAGLPHIASQVRALLSWAPEAPFVRLHNIRDRSPRREVLGDDPRERPTS